MAAVYHREGCLFVLTHDAQTSILSLRTGRRRSRRSCTLRLTPRVALDPLPFLAGRGILAGPKLGTVHQVDEVTIRSPRTVARSRGHLAAFGPLGPLLRFPCLPFFPLLFPPLPLETFPLILDQFRDPSDQLRLLEHLREVNPHVVLVQHRL